MCSPVTLPTGAGTAEVLVDVLYDSHTDSETIVLFPVRQTHGLVAYKLSSVPFSDTYNLGWVSAGGPFGRLMTVLKNWLCCGMIGTISKVAKILSGMWCTTSSLGCILDVWYQSLLCSQYIRNPTLYATFLGLLDNDIDALLL